MVIEGLFSSQCKHGQSSISVVVLADKCGQRHTHVLEGLFTATGQGSAHSEATPSMKCVIRLRPLQPDRTKPLLHCWTLAPCLFSFVNFRFRLDQNQQTVGRPTGPEGIVNVVFFSGDTYTQQRCYVA